MRILALDQASRISGWAIYDGTYLEKYGKIDLSKYDDIGDRLHLLRTKVRDLIEDYHIDKIVLEDIYMDGQHINNVQTFKILAEVFGVLYELCIDINIPVEAVLAGTWKSTLGIKGKTRPEQKQNAQIWVEKTYQVKPTQDEVDAICIGAHAIQKAELEYNWE